jgi:hypothetical protein
MFETAFRAHSLVDAERELVAACIDHESALRIALDTLAVDDFRSHEAHELRQFFYVLAGWLAKGTYDGETNRDRLNELTGGDWAGWLEWGGLLWCTYGVLPEYVQALCEAVTKSKSLMDGALEARRRWQYENPLFPDETAGGQRARPHEYRGGIAL